MDIIPNENELAIRQKLRKKVERGEKLTSVEITWLETHKKYSSLYGYPYLMKDTIDLEKDKIFQFHISFLKATHTLNIEPCFFAPDLAGEISTDAVLYSFHGKKRKPKSVKMLVTQISDEFKDYYFTYQSELGLICVSFYSESIKYGGHITEGSQDSEGHYMIRKDIDEKKIVYHCSANGKDDAFDSLVFLVEWKEIN